MKEEKKQTEEKMETDTKAATIHSVEKSALHALSGALHPRVAGMWLFVLCIFVILGASSIIFSTSVLFSLFRDVVPENSAVVPAVGLDKKEVLDINSFVLEREARFEDARTKPPSFIDPS